MTFLNMNQLGLAVKYRLKLLQQDQITVFILYFNRYSFHYYIQASRTILKHHCAALLCIIIKHYYAGAFSIIAEASRLILNHLFSYSSIQYHSYACSRLPN